jgi:hypothetical protein
MKILGSLVVKGGLNTTYSEDFWLEELRMIWVQINLNFSETLLQSSKIFNSGNDNCRVLVRVIKANGLRESSELNVNKCFAFFC